MMAQATASRVKLLAIRQRFQSNPLFPLRLMQHYLLVRQPLAQAPATARARRRPGRVCFGRDHDARDHRVGVGAAFCLWPCYRPERRRMAPRRSPPNRLRMLTLRYLSQSA